MKPTCKLLALLALALGSLQSALAVDFFWDGNDTTANADGGAGNWNTVLTNWDTLATAGLNTAWPSTGTDNDAVFGVTAGTITVDAGGVTANSLTFNTANYIITGGKITLNGTTPTIANSVATTINSELAGTVGLTKSGAGTLTLGAANTSTGTTTLIAGTLLLTAGNTQIADFSLGSIDARITDLIVSQGQSASPNVPSVNGTFRMGANATSQTGNGEINLSGTGILATARSITKGAQGTATVNFDGGTYKLRAAQATMFGAGVVTNVKAGDLIIDTNTFNGAIGIVATQSDGTVTTTSLYHQDGGVGSSYTLTGGTLIARRIYNNTAGALTWTAVPEPTTALAGILLGFGLLRRRR